MIVATACVLMAASAADAQVISLNLNTCAAYVPVPNATATGIQAKGQWSLPAGKTFIRVDIEMGSMANGVFTPTGPNVREQSTANVPVNGNSPYDVKCKDRPNNSSNVKGFGAGTYYVRASLIVVKKDFLGNEVGSESAATSITSITIN